jgi:pimeloyl-ACP methyl ester carboxylesterase
MLNPWTRAVCLALCIGLPLSAVAADRCLTGASAIADTKAIAAIRGTVNAQCPCASYDGLSPATNHGAFVKCGKAIVKDATDGTPLANGYSLRKQCKGTVQKTLSGSTCGYLASEERVACCEHALASGKNKARVQKAAKCVDSASKLMTRCYATPFASDACSGDATNSCRQKVVQATVDIPSPAQPANTPGSPGVPPSADPRFIAQFGGPSFDLNQARSTRYRLAGPVVQPDAILVLVPGFEGGAGDFKILAENLITKAQAAGSIVEVWGVDRRTNQLEDTAGLDTAETYLDPLVALDWMFGAELGLPLSPVLVAGPNRRANFYNPQADTAFMASWTNLVFSRDIDAVVQAARAAALNQNVFLGGHSAGTGFAARYAATDFDLGAGTDPGFARLRGLVLLEGGGASVPTVPLTPDSLDRMIAKFDGGLYGAVRDNAPRCVDGTTACTIATEAVDCVGQVPPKCTPATFAYSIVPGLLNPKILATGELAGLQSATDPDTGKLVLQADQGSVGNNAVAVVPDLSTLGILPQSTALAGLGNFIDDDGAVAGFATFVSTSVGGPGAVVGGVQTWQDIGEGPLPPALLPNNGPAPTTLPGTIWGVEKEPSRIQRVAETNYVGRTNFTDWYYPNAGPGTTNAPGLCQVGVCVAGNVGAPCGSDNACAQSVGLDSTALSVGRSRPDIENLTQAASINIPVIGFGGSNGLAPVPGRFLGFANSIGPCTAPSCDGSTGRVVDALNPNPAFPTLGDVNGGFEVYISEGYGHVDVLTAEDDATNNVLLPLLQFLQRNTL